MLLSRRGNSWLAERGDPPSPQFLFPKSCHLLVTGNGPCNSRYHWRHFRREQSTTVSCWNRPQTGPTCSACTASRDLTSGLGESRSRFAKNLCGSSRWWWGIAKTHWKVCSSKEAGACLATRLDLVKMGMKQSQIKKAFVLHSLNWDCKYLPPRFPLSNTLLSAFMLVSWYFEPSQPQRITSGLKTMFSLSPFYSAPKSSNHIIIIPKPQNQSWHKFTENIPKHQTQNFRRINSFDVMDINVLVYRVYS